MSRARVLLFTGRGKGKTTAALGMALRACGHGLHTLVIQFVKADGSVGEVKAARYLPSLEIEQYGCGFLPASSSPKFAAHREGAERALERAREALASERYALVILDEICYAVHRRLLAEAAVCALVKSAPASCILALTGRGASRKLQALADTVTEMRCIKHALRAGRRAQKGVER
ncbi:MAG: cob(I)yrinic acid a,c-diamide adenosyltransferase [Candidatus Brocadiia bacterium]|jgi:cob(I)alamin adenosyltransferase